MVAFWAWYAFPPLLTVTIKHNLNLTSTQVANSNIVSLCVTLLILIVAGPLCDLFGPRKVFGSLLLLGAISTGLAPLIHDAKGVYVVRFFMGILGGSFVPCQVWSTAFFDKNIVGTANAMTGGFGNAGGGITYFIMPAVHEVRLSSIEMLETARGEIVQPPTAHEAFQVTFSLHTWAYLCSFGAKLAINSVLAAYYLHNFRSLGQTGASNWAALFGFLNIVTQPLGGIVADLLYGGRNLWWKKHWITACGVLSGVSLVIVGCLNPHEKSTMFGLVALCAIFLEAGNGANFALVPHVRPFANGIVSGLTGAAGNVGGVLFSVVFRFETIILIDNDLVIPSLINYGRSLWIIGVVHIAVNLAVCCIPPIPRNQIGGH
ncbi:hypothetical protein SBRCBS47491_004226 [Sporothrix bragantina]|uniref:Nitrate transporter n=1 Tax=Sporothrix bragantina TaxID=671064 RepID=A0ABP0BN37_9PEZI